MIRRVSQRLFRSHFAPELWRLSEPRNSHASLRHSRALTIAQGTRADYWCPGDPFRPSVAMRRTSALATIHRFRPASVSVGQTSASIIRRRRRQPSQRRRTTGPATAAPDDRSSGTGVIRGAEARRSLCPMPAVRPPAAALLLCCSQDSIAWLAPGRSTSPWRARGRRARCPRVAGRSTRRRQLPRRERSGCPEAADGTFRTAIWCSADG
jgi:hypothetical protein